MTKFKSSIYTLQQKIGEGGFGKVYKAVNQNTQQTVAIKILTLNPELDVDKRRRYIERFERETILGSKLQHPNIVRLLDKGESADDLIYAVFEYIEGISLKQRLLDSPPLAPIEAAKIMSQVLDGLAHAHQQGVVHRDIKPANIMLTQVGVKTHAKILDFGIGALVNNVRQLDYKSITLTQETLGTPSYSAPEQLRGEPPTPKTDLYVWGLVFIECLTGRPAISGSSIASIFQKQLNPANVPLPPALAAHPVSILLRRVLNKKTNERADSALEVYQEFSQLNFSSLVGDISSQKKSICFESGQNQSSLDETQLITENYFSSRVMEHKHISVMCVTLSIRSADGIVNDHEVVNALHRDQKNQCVDIAVRYGATHAGTLGDTLLFYFGYPSVSDNDSRLCARAALEFVGNLKKRNALLKYSQGVVSEARIGLHSGMVSVYSDSIPEGDTPNIAMTLARKAQANQILCSEATRKILLNYIEFDLYQESILGLNAENIPLFILVGERVEEAFGFLRAGYRHQSFIGRTDELKLLKTLLKSRSQLGYAHVFGEAGMGKSRLVYELRSQNGGYNHVVAQCLPEYKNNALFPILNVLRFKFSLNDMDEKVAVKQLIKLLDKQKGVRHKEAVPILCSWLNLTLPENYSESSLSIEEMRNVLFEALVFLLSYTDSAEQNKNCLIVFEDMHWADPVTLEFIAYFISEQSFKKTHHLLISTSREPLPDILSFVKVQTIALQKFNESLSKDFICQLFAGREVSKQVSELITERTDGIPLFIEELVNMLKQKQLIDVLNGRVEFVNSDDVLEVPDSLLGLLQQNLDMLNSAKEVAQLASAIGREFNYQLLKECSNLDETELQNKLNELIQSELVYVQRKVSADSYIFKHALVRDAAYHSMPKVRRQNAHQLIAQALEIGNDDSIQKHAGIIAMHWSRAGVFDKAVYYGNMAAAAALKRSSSNEAIYQTEKVLDWISNLNEAQQTDLLLESYGLLTSAYMETKGWGSREVLQYSQASIKLLESSKRYNELVSHLWWKMLNGIVSGQRTGLEHLYIEMEKLLADVNSINRSAIKCAQGFYLFTEGDRKSARNKLEAALEFYDELADKNHQQVFGFDVGVFSKATLARIYADQNQDEKACHFSELAIQEAKSYQHIPSIGISLMYHGLVRQQYQQSKNVEQSAKELIDLSDKYALPIYKGFGQMLYDWSQDDTSRADETLKMLKNAGSRHGLGHFQSFYAEVYAKHRNYQQAIAKINECLQLDENIGERNYLAYLWYKKACYMRVSGSFEEEQIVNYVQQAMHLAEQQSLWFIVNKTREVYHQISTSKQT